MARVFIDPHVHSTDWFPGILEELVRSKKVTFLFSNCEKGVREVGKVGNALKFKKLMIKSRRGIQADASILENRKRLLETEVEFVNCPECDDGHIFAAIYVHPTKFVFSCDKRIAKCRSKLVGKVSRRYCGFIVISSGPVYRVHREAII